MKPSKPARKKSIGVFDSGFGGLHILKGIVKKLPAYDYVYLGDTARTPYGTRSRETVYAFTEQGVDFLFRKGCGLVILACNTASSEALRRIQREYLPRRHPGKRVLGVIIPTAERTVEVTRGKRVGVIATEGTVASGTFVKEIKKLDPKVEVFQQACPLIVPLIEAGEHRTPLTSLTLKRYLASLREKRIDTLVLGCTHYGLIGNSIKAAAGKGVSVVSQAGVVAAKLRKYLARHPEIERALAKRGSRRFYSTDRTEKFNTLGSVFFGKKIHAKQVTLA